MALVHGHDLTSIDISADGETVGINVRDKHGTAGSLELPAPIVNQLLMTLPRVVEQALRNRHDNQSLRLVHALECFRIESGEPDENGTPRYVLTLRTHGGYEVPFAMTGHQLGVVVQTVVDQVLCDGAEIEPVTLNA